MSRLVFGHIIKYVGNCRNKKKREKKCCAVEAQSQCGVMFCIHLLVDILFQIPVIDHKKFARHTLQYYYKY